MKLSALCIGVLASAVGTRAACTLKPCSGKCVAAISEASGLGEAFCSSYLSLEPATTTVTEVATVTGVSTDIVTDVEVVPQTTSTATILGPTVTVFQRRQAASGSADPSANILSKCSSAASRISSACSCALSTTSTVTVVETVTSTELGTLTATTTETITTGVVATESVSPTYTAPANIVPNGGFESYVTTGNIMPWTDTAGVSGGRVEVVNGVNPCTAGAAYCAGGQVVVRVYPASGGYAAVVQKSMAARPSSTYNVSFMYRCLNFDSRSAISVYYAGNLIGTSQCISSSSAFTRVTSGITFQTDETGVGDLEIRFGNAGGSPYLYYYADDFQATRIE